jgi:hypothetical protein
MDSQQNEKISRRTMLASLGATGAAVVAGGMLHSLNGETTVSASVYSDSGKGPKHCCIRLFDVTQFATVHLDDDITYNLIGYHPGSGSSAPRGGGLFRWNPSRPKADHNGGTVFSPTVPYGWSDDGLGYLIGTGESAPSGTGCFERLDAVPVSPDMFGAYGNYDPLTNTGNNDHYALQAAIDTGLTVELRSVYRNHQKELLFVTQGQLMHGYSSGKAYGAEPWLHKPITGIVCTGEGQRYRKTRRLAPETALDPNDNPISTGINIQADAVHLRDFSLSLYCDFTDTSPSNRGADFDVGIMNGCRPEVVLTNLKVMGYWRIACIYVDVTRGATTAEFTSPDGVTYPSGDAIKCADQMSIYKVFCWGGVKGLAIFGAKMSASGTYYDAETNTVLSTHGGRGGGGASDFHAIDCTFFSYDHHGKRRFADPLSPLNYANENIDTIPCCVAIDGRRGSTSQGRLRKNRFTNCRFATVEFARVVMDRCYEIVFDNCHSEPKGSNVVYSSTGADITATYSDQSTLNYGPYAGKSPSGAWIGTDQIAIIRSNVAPNATHFPAAITRTEIATVSNGRTVLQSLEVQSITSAMPIGSGSSANVGQFNINDDEVLVLDVPTNTFSGMMFINSNLSSGPSAVLAFRAASSNSFVTHMGGDTANLNLIHNTVLSGTTGSDGSINISTTNGKIYMENRRGSTRSYKIHLFY